MRNMPDVWIWTELLAFDNTQVDLGVSAYYDAMGFVPEGISLLITGMDFVLQHEDWDGEHIYPEDCCTRLGHHGNGVRQRQAWTNYQLKHLVQLLQARGTKIVFSLFPYYLQDKFHKEFGSIHRKTLSGPEYNGGYNMLGHLNDGTAMEDYFVQKLSEVVEYYGFDGWHGPDGFGPFFHGILCRDLGNDMVAQFREAIGKERFAPEYDHDLPAGGDFQGRMAWIWENLREEWIDYLTSRSMRVWEKILGLLHQKGRVAVVNSADTNGIFGAWYYEAFDYRALARMGLDVIIVESTITGFSLLKGERDYLTELSAMMQEVSASVPGVKVCMMPSIKDAVESYDSMIHAHGMFERDVHYLTSRCIYRNGHLERTASGFCVCLGDYLRAQDWAELRALWAQAWAFQPARSGELTWLHEPASYEALRKEHRQFGTEESYFEIGKLEEVAGLDISVIATPEELDALQEPLIVPNFHLLTEDLQKRILAKPQLLVLLGNLALEKLPRAAYVTSLSLAPGLTLSCAILHSKLPHAVAVNDKAFSQAVFQSSPKRWNSYSERPPHREIPDEFWLACGTAIRSALGESPLKSDADAPTTAFTMRRDTRKELGLFRQWDAKGNERMGIYSRSHLYSAPSCFIGDDGVSITIRSEFPRGELCSRNGWLLCDEPFGKPVHVPPCGILVADLDSGNKKT